MIDLKALVQYLEETLETMPDNRFTCSGSAGQFIWGKPLLGIAAGDDELFVFFKQDIGEFYWLPAEAFALQYPATEISRLSVLSMAFPHAAETRQEQRCCVRDPSPRWRYSRRHWPEFMTALCDRLTLYFAERGIRSVAPELLPQWDWRQSAKYGNASNWSQRHTAYAAGLGTFGLSDGLITRKGKAARFISLIIEADIPATPREYASHLEWCRHFQNGSCGACVRRCPAGAITATGHDKALCLAYNRLVYDRYAREGEGASGCGLCQTGTPCESGKP